MTLAFERRGGRTVLTRSRFTLPLQVMTPMDLDDPAAVVSVLNPTGGLVGGDRLSIDVTVALKAHAVLTTPSATKVYRAAGPPTMQDVTLRVADDAVLEWVPDHTIPFAGAAFRQRIGVELGDGARLILVDAWAAGRVARAEAWTFAELASALAVRDRAGWIFLDRFVLTGAARWAGLGLAEGHPYFATIVIVGDDTAGLGRAVADAIGPRDDVVLAVGALARRGAVVRCLALTAPALTATVDAVWTLARRRLIGVPPPALRKG
ncbi:MAG: urease accessory protein UreD [Candidatus Rokubacteria bacterium]|nr:urease accessory protein UreD [Candidatus Rokubacteria bacterium]